ncbi:MAG: SDR family NAD(P)-dependent oxidoreductase [Chloroflexi bacterium]|nr:SDR family NAD(P)-dependent oxidoreductase [Chloroflexota bacterium]
MGAGHRRIGGLGEEFARQMSAAGTNLVLVARREDRLNAVADELSKAHGIQTKVIAADLSLPDVPQAIYDQLRADGIGVDVLISNAGSGLYGKFTDIAWEREQQMLDIDIATVVRMTRLFVPDMVARKFGYVLQVASIGAFLPSPLYAQLLGRQGIRPQLQRSDQFRTARQRRKRHDHLPGCDSHRVPRRQRPAVHAVPTLHAYGARAVRPRVD